MELISKLIRSLRDDEQGKTWEPERMWLRNQDESKWSLNTSLMLRFGALFSRTRWSFLEAKCSRCSEFDGSICCSNRRNANEATSHDDSFDHLVVNQELVEEWKRRHVCSLSKIVESQGFLENHRRPPNCSG